MTTLAGGIPDRVPVVPQAFLFSVESAGLKMSDVVRSPERMARALAECRERYSYDGCIIDFDDATLAEACGAKVIYRDEDPAIVDESCLLIQDYAQVKDLELPDPLRSARLPVWLETTRKLVELTDDEVFVMGRADQGPFDLACLLRGAENFMTDMIEGDPEEIAALIDYCRRAVTLFAKAQKDAGAHATSIGDSFAGPNLISPALYRQFALGPEIDLTAEVQAYGIPFSIHICGNTAAILADMVTTGAKILELDWEVDLAEATRLAGGRCTILGNINPSDPMAFGTPDEVDRLSRAAIQATGGRHFILSSGCALGRNTKPENVKAMVDAARNYGANIS
jgi:MtaA/CmuA family methyltransferase